MNDRVTAQSSPGRGPKRTHSPDHDLTVTTDQPLSEVIAEDNRFMGEVLSKSSKEHVVTSAKDGDDCVVTAAKDYLSITELLSQSSAIIHSLSRMELTLDRRKTISDPPPPPSKIHTNKSS